ncbi:MAG: polyprenyl synthetase family protein [Cellvibrionales bacterium]|nr:polyprenyl synthetase family protein [Cellvibrionales bacterium]MBK8677076.1 polyprenyl synthetase family protein [Cellvibrionales bacterium]HRG49968.1 polyprenyl synthetase family protein [Pseudomonadales bacterium]
MLSFHQAVAEDFAAVNALIIEQLHSRVALVENIGHYIVDAGGKRLRPLLVLLAARSLGYNGKQHVDMAAVIEFIHTATLLHDDVVDVSALRRGRATANAEWGNAPSVLVGDFLYSRAFQMLVALGDMQIMQIMADTTNTIAEGEVLQLVNAGDITTNEERYRRVIACKTAQLFEAAAQCGAIIAGADTDTQKEFAQYGHHLGMAFQLIDDVLDYTGDSAEMGKNIGDDLSEGKLTLPLIYTLQFGETADAQCIRDAITHKNTEQLPRIIQIVQNNGALQYAEQAALREVESALGCLNTLPASRYRDELTALAHFAIKRRT